MAKVPSDSEAITAIISAQRDRYGYTADMIAQFARFLLPVPEARRSALGGNNAIPLCRFRQRNLELEAETRHQQQTLTTLRNDLDTMRSDNVKLYEKIKFVSTYQDRKPIEDSTTSRCVLAEATRWLLTCLPMCQRRCPRPPCPPPTNSFCMLLLGGGVY